MKRAVISDDDTKLQAIQIARLIELTLHFCSDSGLDTPALWTCRRISQLKNIKENFDLILDGLFRLAREFPRCMNYVASVVINNQDFCRNRITKARIARWCRASIKAHALHGHDFEVAWTVAVCGALKIRLKPTDFGPKSFVPRPTTMALVGLLEENGILTGALASWGWRRHLKRSGILGPYWLPYYEAVRRGWTKDKQLIRTVQADPILSKMIAENVTFLDERIFNAVQLRLPRRSSVGASAKIRTTRGITQYRAAKKAQTARGFGSLRLLVTDQGY